MQIYEFKNNEILEVEIEILPCHDCNRKMQFIANEEFCAMDEMEKFYLICQNCCDIICEKCGANNGNSKKALCVLCGTNLK